MKKIIISAILLPATIFLKAQTPEEASTKIYYERYASAESAMHRFLQNEPTNAGGWYELTEAYLLQGKIHKAHDSLLLAPKQVQLDPYFKVAMGEALLMNGNKQEASQYFSQALDDTKEKNSGILAAVAKAHIRYENGDIQYAIDLLHKAVKRDKHNSDLYVLLGNAYRKQANGSEAYKAYQQAIEENPKNASAYHNLGEIFLTQKNAELYLEYFNKAVAADPNYAPSLYRLYAYEFYHDPVKAMNLYKDYVAKSDPTIQNKYDMADLLYLNKQYPEAIGLAEQLVKNENHVKPRVYKLISYSYAALKDTARALASMQEYFSKEADSNLISKDYIALGDYYFTMPDQDSLATIYITKGIDMEKDAATRYDLYKKMAIRSNDKKDFINEARWWEKYNSGNTSANNLDLFNWGLALYRAEDYQGADSVFGLYTTKFPDQSFGYYWQAKSKALQDKEMKQGLAIDAYEKLIDVLEKDTTDANYKKWIVEAYNYLAAYEVNTQMDYAQAVDYFEKVLEVDPENESAKKYIALLEKSSLQKTDN